jgi:hypothetical protein
MAPGTWPSVWSCHLAQCVVPPMAQCLVLPPFHVGLGSWPTWFELQADVPCYLAQSGAFQPALHNACRNHILIS